MHDIIDVSRVERARYQAAKAAKVQSLPSMILTLRCQTFRIQIFLRNILGTIVRRHLQLQTMDPCSASCLEGNSSLWMIIELVSLYRFKECRVIDGGSTGLS